MYISVTMKEISEIKISLNPFEKLESFRELYCTSYILMIDLSRDNLARDTREEGKVHACDLVDMLN